MFGLDEKFLDLMKSLRWKKLEFPLPLRVPASISMEILTPTMFKTFKRTKLKSQHLCRLSIFVIVVVVVVVVVVVCWP